MIENEGTLSERGNLTEGDINQSDLRAKWHAAQVGWTSAEMLRRDESVFLKQSLSTPCLTALRSAEGSWIEDMDGRRFLDFHGNMVHQVGHRHPKVVAAVREQLETLPFCPFQPHRSFPPKTEVIVLIASSTSLSKAG